ncbi:hypothetical protein BDK51DRAFT_51451, partial [Blyttiomyces helicus]
FQEDLTAAFLIPATPDPPTSSSPTPDSDDDSPPPSPRALLSTLEFYRTLSRFAQDRFGPLCNALGECMARERKVCETIDVQYRYVYHNAATLAFRTSIGLHRSTTLVPEVLRCIDGLREDLTSSQPLTEACLETTSPEAWVSATRIADRQFYLVLPKTDGGIADVGRE